MLNRNIRSCCSRRLTPTGRVLSSDRIDRPSRVGRSKRYMRPRILIDVWNVRLVHRLLRYKLLRISHRRVKMTGCMRVPHGRVGMRRCRRRIREHWMSGIILRHTDGHLRVRGHSIIFIVSSKIHRRPFTKMTKLNVCIIALSNYRHLATAIILCLVSSREYKSRIRIGLTNDVAAGPILIRPMRISN
jgi:hypothetical protein